MLLFHVVSLISCLEVQLRAILFDNGYKIFIVQPQRGSRAVRITMLMALLGLGSYQESKLLFRGAGGRSS